MGIFVSILLSSMMMTNAVALSLGLVLFILAFVKTEIALYLLIFSMLLSPEISFGVLSEKGIAGGREVVIRLDDLFLMLIAFGWLAKIAINKSMGLVEKSPLNSYIYFYVAAFTLATGVGALYGNVDTRLGFFNVLKLVQYFILYFMVLNHTDSEDSAKRLVIAAIAVGVIIAMYSLYQIPTGQRVTAPFEGEGGEPNTLGGYMILMISLNLALFLESEGIMKKVGFGIISFLCLVSLLYTESRSSYLGLLAAVITLIVLSRSRKLLMVGVLIVVVFSTILLPDRVIERINYTFTPNEQQELNPFSEQDYDPLDPSTRARLESWENAFEGWKKYPIMGWGITGFVFIDAQFMKVLVETGTIGFIAFMLLMYKIFTSSRRMVYFVGDKSNFFRAISIGFFAGFIGLCAHAIGANTFIIIRIMEPFWLLAGIVMSFPKFIPANGNAVES